MKMKKSILCLLVGAGSASAATVTVTQFEPNAAVPVVDTWYLNSVTAGGSASIQDLTGVGGNLETNQPLPNGAARLTTNATDAAKAEVSTWANFGSASSVLNSISLSYDFYKTLGPVAAPAPSLKLTLWSSTGTGDNYGTLIYEPYWNPFGSAVPTDAWTAVAIDQNTGSGADPSGGWWWNGGFEIPSGGGGPPLRSLAEWATAFAAADATDFATANVVGLSVGIGTYNQSQDNYFDNVSIATGNTVKTYDFGGRSVPDGGTTLILLGGALTGIAAVRRKLRA
jgi:hypothetical protein